MSNHQNQSISRLVIQLMLKLFQCICAVSVTLKKEFRPVNSSQLPNKKVCRLFTATPLASWDSIKHDLMIAHIIADKTGLMSPSLIQIRCVEQSFSLNSVGSPNPGARAWRINTTFADISERAFSAVQMQCLEQG